MQDSHQIKARRLFLEHLEDKFDHWLQEEIKKLQATCIHPSIECSTGSEDIGIDCVDCGKLLLDPYPQGPV